MIIGMDMHKTGAETCNHAKNTSQDLTRKGMPENYFVELNNSKIKTTR